MATDKRLREQHALPGTAIHSLPAMLVVAAFVILLPRFVQAECMQQLATVDEQLASTSLDANLRNAVQQFRDHAASLCAEGHEASATQTLGMVGMMLTQAQSATAEPVAESLVRKEPKSAESPARADFPNRWDKLSQVDYCDWLTPDELARQLTLHAPLECRRTDNGFRYELPRDGDDWPVAFFLLIEVHPGQESVRKAEAGVSEGFAKRLFTPFDPGTAELNVYVSNKGHYLYAFPAGGLTLWRLEYIKASPERDKYYSPSPGRSGNADLGPRFIEILVDKYRDKL